MTHASQPTRFFWAQQLPGVQVICKELLLGESTSVMTASDDDEATGQTCPTRTVARTRGRGRWSLKDGGGSWRSPSVSDARLPVLGGDAWRCWRSGVALAFDPFEENSRFAPFLGV